MNKIKLLFFFFIVTIISCFSSCVLDSDDVIEESSSSSNASGSSKLTAVTISGSTSISYNGTATLTATATYNGSKTITYEWSITSGSNYVTLTASDSTATLVANNTTDSEQTVKIQVVATVSSTSITSSEYEIMVAKKGTTVEDSITSVTISGTNSISASGSTTLTASSSYTGNPTITYEWLITSGSDYATLTYSGSTATLVANNTTDSEQSVTVQVTASDGTNSFSGTYDVSVAEKKSTSDSYNASSTVSSEYSNIIYIDLGSALVSSDNSSWSEITTTVNQVIDDVKVKFTESDDVSTGLVRINATDFSGSLAVYLSGTNDSSVIGGIKIQSNGSDKVAVFLNDAKITSTNYPCVEITKGSDGIIDVSGTNTFVDGRSYGTGYGEEYSTTSGTYTDDDGNSASCTVVKAAVQEGSDSKGTLFCKGNMTISGSGSLSVTQAYKNCIATKEGTLTINGGTFTLKNYTSSSNTGKNGLFGGAGIVVNDGSITFDGKGIISTSDLRKANGFKTDDDTYTSSSVTLNGGTVSVTTYNGKGITAPYVYIKDGTNTFNVTGVTTYAENSKTGTYYDADGVKQTNATIKFAAEGIEGASLVQISGGETYVTAVDDGLNVSDDGASFTMSDGYLYVYASGGDGIDSNGNISISGGYIVSIAPTGSEDALDWADTQTGNYNGSCTITGGYIAGVSGSAESPDSVSNAGVVIMSPSISSGSSIAIGSSTSSIGYAFTVPSVVSSSDLKFFMCSSKLTGSSYTVYSGCTLSGGSNWNGLYYEMPTVSVEGTSSSVSLSNQIYSNVSSGQGGGNQQGGGTSQGGNGGGPSGNSSGNSSGQGGKK